MLSIFYDIKAWKDWCVFASLCNSNRHLYAAASEVQTLCSLFASCISLTFINLLPSIIANETLAQCLPLGHRQLQLPIIQCWSWIKDKLCCHVSVATIHQPVMQGTYCGRSGDIFNYCQLLNYPQRRGARSWAARCVVESIASCFGSKPWVSCAQAHGTRNKTWGFSGFFMLV